MAVVIAIAVIGITFMRSRLSPNVNRCREGTVTSYHPGECRELLAIEKDKTFPWDKQQAEAQEFFRQFQKEVQPISGKKSSA